MQCLIPKRRFLNVDKTVTINISSTSAFNGDYAWVIINDVEYWKENMSWTVEAEQGDVITLYVEGWDATVRAGYVYLNGTEYFRSTSYLSGGCTWTIPNNVSEVTIVMDCYRAGGRTCGRIYITTSY